MVFQHVARARDTTSEITRTHKKNVRTVKERGTYTVWHMNEQDDMHVCVRLKCGCTFRNTDTNTHTHTFFWHLELLNAESTTVSIAVRLAICSKPHGVVQIDLFDAALSTLRCWCYSSICNRNKWTIELIKTTLNRSVWKIQEQHFNKSREKNQRKIGT